MRRAAAIVCALALPGMLTAASAEFDFSEGRWSRADFWEVKSPRWNEHGAWVQLPDAIANLIPERPGRKSYGHDCYAALVWKEPVEGPVEISSTMSFDVRMAPLIVIAPELADAKDGLKEFREHWEVVLYDKGINVWRHEFRDGKPSWYLAAYLEEPFAPKMRHRLTVRIAPRRGRMFFSVMCGGREFGYFEPAMAQRFHVGVTGCEGPCRFYDLKVDTDIKEMKR